MLSRLQHFALPCLQTVHVKNRCAWLNHSSNPKVFMDLVRQHPNIKLWFSGRLLEILLHADADHHSAALLIARRRSQRDCSSRQGCAQTAGEDMLCLTA